MIEIPAQISDVALRDYDLLRDDCGLLNLPNVSLVTLKGDDRKGWLQGQATADLRKLDFGASNVFCLTAITGHLVSVCEVWALSDALFLTVPSSTLENVLKRVEQMVIMEDVVGEEVSHQFQMFSVQGPTATSRLGRLMPLPSLDAGESTLSDMPVYALRSNRTGLGGWDVWVPKASAAAMEVLTSEFPPIGNEAYNIARLEAGIPLFGADMNEKTFPPEMGKAFEERHVSYSKGCYMGQEVLMRIHSRGHTNKTWVGLASEKPLDVGSSVGHRLRPEAGTVTSAAFSPDFGYIGAAMLRNEAVFEGEVVQVTTSQGIVEAEVRQMPILR